MGGNALSFGTKRLERREYFKLAKEVETKFLAHGIPVTPVKAYASKESFGDLDIVVHIKHFHVLEETIQKVFEPKEIVKNGNCWSFDVEDFQVDLIHDNDPEWMWNWMNFNDISNLIGRIAHKFGMKFGQAGLTYPVRVGDNKLGEVVVSKNFRHCIEFLGFDSDRYFEGFDTLEDIFEFIIAGKYFNPSIYLLDNRNAKSRVRDAKRPTYMKFLKHIEGMEGDWFEFDTDKIVYFNFIVWNADYPEQFRRFVEVVFEENAKREALKGKFNGTILSELTGLKGKELGMLMGRIRDKYSPEEIMSWDRETLKTYVTIDI